MTALEIAYRSQSSRIFKNAPYERNDVTYKQLIRLFPNKSMSLENPGFKTSEFQPTRPPSAIPPSQFSVNMVRAAHATAGRNAAQMGFPVTAGTYPMDTTYSDAHHVVKAEQPPDDSSLGRYSNQDRNTLNNASRKRGASEQPNDEYAQDDFMDEWGNGWSPIPKRMKNR